MTVESGGSGKIDRRSGWRRTKSEISASSKASWSAAASSSARAVAPLIGVSSPDATRRSNSSLSTISVPGGSSSRRAYPSSGIGSGGAPGLVIGLVHGASVHAASHTTEHHLPPSSWSSKSPRIATHSAFTSVVSWLTNTTPSFGRVPSIHSWTTSADRTSDNVPLWSGMNSAKIDGLSVM